MVRAVTEMAPVLTQMRDTLQKADQKVVQTSVSMLTSTERKLLDLALKVIKKPDNYYDSPRITAEELTFLEENADKLPEIAEKATKYSSLGKMKKIRNFFNCIAIGLGFRDGYLESKTLAGSIAKFIAQAPVQVNDIYKVLHSTREYRDEKLDKLVEIGNVLTKLSGLVDTASQSIGKTVCSRAAYSYDVDILVGYALSNGYQDTERETVHVPAEYRQDAPHYYSADIRHTVAGLKAKLSSKELLPEHKEHIESMCEEALRFAELADNKQSELYRPLGQRSSKMQQKLGAMKSQFKNCVEENSALQKAQFGQRGRITIEHVKTKVDSLRENEGRLQGKLNELRAELKKIEEKPPAERDAIVDRYYGTTAIQVVEARVSRAEEDLKNAKVTLVKAEFDLSQAKLANEKKVG